MHIVWDLEFLAAVIASSVRNKQDQVLGICLRYCVEENLEALGIGRRHDQKDARSVLRADCTIQINIFTNKLGGNLRPDADRSPAPTRPGHPPEARLVREHDAQAPAAPGGSPPGFPYS